MLYKIGRQATKRKTDTNCANFEDLLIEKEVGTSNNLFILNGMTDDVEEISFVKQIIGICKGFGNKVIYIATDYDLMKFNAWAIELCDEIIHSSTNPEFDLKIVSIYGKPSQFGYIPFLYYDENKFESMSEESNDTMVTGGSFSGNIWKDGILDNFIKVVGRNSLFVLSRESKEDTRIPYNDYLNLIHASKFYPCFKRKSFEETGWMNVRFVDAATCWSLPMVFEPNYGLKSTIGYDNSLVVKDHYGYLLYKQMWNSNGNRKTKILEVRKLCADGKEKCKKVLQSLK